MKKSNLALLCLTVAMVNTGCGGNKSTRPNTPPPESTAAPAVTAPEPTRTVAPEVIKPPTTAQAEAPKPATPPAATPPPVEAPAPFTGIVAAHNAVRAKVGVPPLSWSAGVASYAQAWADQLKTKNCEMAHRSDRQYGENLAWSGGMGLTPEGVVQMWAGEAVNYDYAGNRCQAGAVCGHYTQVVWRGSSQLGCGMARCGDGREIWVCNYNPPGNYIGQKPY